MRLRSSIAWRLATALLGAGLLLTWAGWPAEAWSADTPRTGDSTGGNGDALAAGDAARGLDAPADLVRHVKQRQAMDQFAARHHAVEGGTNSAVLRPPARYQLPAAAVPIVRAKLPASVVAYRSTNANPVRPLRGFRAPILDRADERVSPVFVAEGASPGERSAAEVVARELAAQRLLPTTARVIEILGSDRLATNGSAGVRELSAVGVPVDLLSFFPPPGSTNARPEDVVAQLASQLRDGVTAETLAPALRERPFVFRPTHPAFRLAAEAGATDLKLVRMQIGGGYRGGLVPGGSFDVCGQLIAALPDADFLITMPEEYAEIVHWLARHAWPVRRANRVTFTVEPFLFTAWAQDNAKGGVLRGSGAPASLAPRYASQSELGGIYYPRDSYLMDGLRAAGHPVLQSSLLFQGGNLLAFRSPSLNQRVLLLADTELHRNRTLGLSVEQVREAFRIEFGVDRCEVVPAVSYHLDYDVLLRVKGGEVLAFVNDPVAAARLIVGCGLKPLEAGGLLTVEEVTTARDQLAKNQTGDLLRLLAPRVARQRTREGPFRESFAQLFAGAPTDPAAFNLQCFLAALEVFASRTEGVDVPDDAREHHAMLRAQEAVAKSQSERLTALGLRVVPVPSMPDLYASVNYLNGLQERSRLLMPAMGGLLGPLDDAAAKAFEDALGPEVKIVRVFTAGIQELHGVVHCVASVYPADETPPLPPENRTQ